jgi:hypothetical protein
MLRMVAKDRGETGTIHFSSAFRIDPNHNLLKLVLSNS